MDEMAAMDKPARRGLPERKVKRATKGIKENQDLKALLVKSEPKVKRAIQANPPAMPVEPA